MTIIQFCIKNEIGLSTFKMLFDFLSIKQKDGPNYKIDNNDIEFLQNQLNSIEFNNYLSLFIKTETFKYKNQETIFSSLILKELEKISKYERVFIINHILKRYKISIQKDKDLNNLLTLQEYSVVELQKVLNFYVKIKKESKKYDVDSNNDGIDEEIDIEKDVIDYENVVMNALMNGDAESFGF